MLLLIGGLDPTGGAGVLRDFATARRFDPRLPTRTLVSAWTRQGHGRPAEVEFVGEHAWQKQLEGVTGPIGAIKVGVFPAGGASFFCDWWDRQPIPIPLVLDPVLHASDGGRLGDAEMLEPLAMRATLLTPNRPEARVLEATPWFSKYAGAWLAKGGHAEASDEVCDALRVGEKVFVFKRPRQKGSDVRGTGCALATAIAAGLARGVPLKDAVAQGIAWLDAQRERAPTVDGDGVYLP